jgi:hypothetical protein
MNACSQPPEEGRVTHHKSGTTDRNKASDPQRPRCVYYKGTSTPPETGKVGVSTYLALTFGTLLSSQGTDASFGTLSGPSGLFPSVLRVSDSIRFISAVPPDEIRWPLDWPIAFRLFTTLTDFPRGS